MPTGAGGTRPADAGPATASCSGRHPQAPAVSAVRIPAVRTPTFWTPTTVPGAAADSQGVHGVRFHRHPDTGRRVRLRQDGGGPAAAVAVRRQDRACRICSSVLVKWPGQRSQGRTAVPMRGHRTRPAEHREPTRPGDADTRDHRWTAGSRTVHHPAAMSDRNGTPMCGTGQHARLTARSVAWCSASIWSAPDGSGLLRLDASSIWSDPDGSRPIVWMIKRMIKQARLHDGQVESRPDLNLWSIHTTGAPHGHRSGCWRCRDVDRQGRRLRGPDDEMVYCVVLDEVARGPAPSHRDWPAGGLQPGGSPGRDRVASSDDLPVRRCSGARPWQAGPAGADRAAGGGAYAATVEVEVPLPWSRSTRGPATS
jgi:hypothetical protein